MEFNTSNSYDKTAEKIAAIDRQFILMRANGTSIRDIAKKLKKSPTTICGMNKKFSKYIFNLRNSQFSELQRKVIDLKLLRLNFLKKHLEKVMGAMNNDEILEGIPDWEYLDSIQVFTKLSELMTACEFDLLSVGTNFKENLQPESNDLLDGGIDVHENPETNDDENCNNITDVIKNCNSVSDFLNSKAVENIRLNASRKRNGTNCNTKKHKKIKIKSP